MLLPCVQGEVKHK